MADESRAPASEKEEAKPALDSDSNDKREPADPERVSSLKRTDEAMESLRAQEEARGERPAPEAGNVSKDTDPEFLHPQHGEGDSEPSDASSASDKR